MSQNKIIILLLLGILVVLLSKLRMHKDSFSVSTYNQQFSSLGWNGNELLLTKKRINDLGEGGFDSLPAKLKPLIFQKIPVNSASFELLMTVPGIGKKTALQIVQLQEKLSRITEPEDLMTIKGIGKKKMLVFEKYLSFE